MSWEFFHFHSQLFGWFGGLVVMMINVDLAIFQPYLDLKAGDNQSLKIQVARPGIEPRSSCSASQELNHSATAAPFNFLNYFLWLRITDEGLVPEMRIWSISLIKSDLKWCTHLSSSLFLISTTWWVSLLVDQGVPEGACSQVLRSTSVDS